MEESQSEDNAYRGLSETAGRRGGFSRTEKWASFFEAPVCFISISMRHHNFTSDFIPFHYIEFCVVRQESILYMYKRKIKCQPSNVLF